MYIMDFLVMLIEQSDYTFIDGDGNHYKPDSYNVAENFISHLFEENLHEWLKEYKPDPYHLTVNFISHLFEENFHEWVKEYNRVVED